MSTQINVTFKDGEKCTILKKDMREVAHWIIDHWMEIKSIHAELISLKEFKQGR